MFRSPRQAIAYMAAFERGPQLAQQDLHRIARGSRRGSMEAFHTSLAVSRFIYGPKPQCLGVQRGGELDRALREWAMSGENSAQYYTPPVAQAVGALVGYLRERGLKVDPPVVERRKPPTEGVEESVRVDFVDTETGEILGTGWQNVETGKVTGKHWAKVWAKQGLSNNA